MSLSRWDEGSDSDQLTGLKLDGWLVGHRKILAWQWAKLPRYWREGAVEVRPFTAKKRLYVSEAQGLSNEAMKRNPMPTAIPRVDESKSTNNRRVDRTRTHPHHPRAYMTGMRNVQRGLASRTKIITTIEESGKSQASEIAKKAGLGTACVNYHLKLLD